ncbi:pyridoxal phosphate-dependent decarboxylase family protein [Plantibacter sp. YIM 135249]|uniref:pyridoxal phosphate-dependent decarboxylase family protein n=1 Tax=Plantibacter sp. YIM 135249 TaxID=3423918 RepID=UPI003D34BBD1
MFERLPSEVLAELATLRERDAPTHGGHVLSYVYDPGVAELDELAASAMLAVQSVNGLDPTTFPSVAAMERDIVWFVRAMLHGRAVDGDDVPSDGTGPDTEVVGSVTSGGTESCLLAVKTARDVWRAAGGTGTPVLLAPSTVHAAFHKAAWAFGLELDLVPVDAATGTLTADALVSRLSDRVALVVCSAPGYPFAALDPIEEVAAACAERGIALHVDACIGGFALPWWDVSRADGDDRTLPAWDFRVRGVTSISADVHKYGYSPKGASVLLQRGRDRQRHQYFALSNWPGYPVVNPTLLGSKSAGALAAAWAIVQALGDTGYATLVGAAHRATDALEELVSGIDGLRVLGDPTGPLFAVCADEDVPPDRRVDPHHWADRVKRSGWLIQSQPGLIQGDGTRLPHTTHLTVTPVTEQVLEPLGAALIAAADEVRGVPRIEPEAVLAGLSASLGGAPLPEALDSATSWLLLERLGVGAGGAMPSEMAPLLALIEAVPSNIAERLLIELIARLVEP